MQKVMPYLAAWEDNCASETVPFLHKPLSHWNVRSGRFSQGEVSAEVVILPSIILAVRSKFSQEASSRQLTRVLGLF